MISEKQFGDIRVECEGLIDVGTGAGELVLTFKNIPDEDTTDRLAQWLKALLRDRLPEFADELNKPASEQVQ